MIARNILKLVSIFAVLLALTGCLVSLDEIVPESDAIFDPRLVGTWELESTSDRAVITRASKLTYAIEFTRVQ